MNHILQQEVTVNKNLAEKFKIKAETLEAELASVKTSYKNKSEKLESDFELLKNNIEEQKHKNVSCTLNLISMFLFTFIFPVQIQVQQEDLYRILTFNQFTLVKH
jgi:hypothetical protein